MANRLMSLCSGYGGLDLAIERVLGVSSVAFCEKEDAPSKVLAERWPGLPNYGDVKALTWARETRPAVVAAGYPCQPFSHAGFRRGVDDPRHLWPAISDGVAICRPELLVLENVRNHLTLGWSTVVADLDQLGYDVRWTLLRASDVGACHARARLFALAVDRERGGLAALSRPPAASCGDGRVWGHEGLFGAIERTASMPPAGVMVRGDIWEERPLIGGVPTDLLATPRAGDRQASQAALARGELKGRLEAQVALLGTPQARDWKGKPGHGFNEGSLLHSLTLLPTPRASDGEKGGPNQRGADGDLMLPSAVQPSRFGVYAAAVARWERLTRPAPAPTVPGRKNPQPNPAFVEWMMGLSEGWVTEVPGLNRREEMTMLGNGVVPQQAQVALSALTLLAGISEPLIAEATS